LAIQTKGEEVEKAKELRNQVLIRDHPGIDLTVELVFCQSCPLINTGGEMTIVNIPYSDRSYPVS